MYNLREPICLPKLIVSEILEFLAFSTTSTYWLIFRVGNKLLFGEVGSVLICLFRLPTIQ